jgi:prefoldin subunit 5
MANAETIEQLREERSILAKEHKTLQRRFAEISEVGRRLCSAKHTLTSVEVACEPTSRATCRLSGFAR